MNRFKVAGLLSVTMGVVFALSAQSVFADGSCLVQSSDGTDVAIPLNDQQMPASDLVCDAKCLQQIPADQQPQPNAAGQVILNPDDAGRFKTNYGVDLSSLQPDPTTDIWRPTSSSADESQDNALPVADWDWVNFQADICSPSGVYRFNIATQPKNGMPSQVLTAMVSPTNHTVLLRKELLRKLGYVIPPMKFISHVKVHFPDAKTRDSVILLPFSRLANATRNGAEHWCGMAESVMEKEKLYTFDPNTKEKYYSCASIPDADLNGDPLEVEFQDLMVMQATPLYYNTALGPPIVQIPSSSNLRAEQYRTLRALAVIYDLVYVPESVNQFDWYAAYQKNGSVFFHIDDQANFATSYDDAAWIVRKIAALSREDIQEIVTNSFYPQPIADVLVEKIISRRNSLVAAFGLKDVAPQDIAFNTKIDAKVGRDDVVKDGKIIQKDWDGYASRFAAGDPANPLQGLWWYVLSIVQSNAMSSLMNYANTKIPQLAEMSAGAQTSLTNAMINAFNGTTGTVNFGMWHYPVVNGSVQISRDIVLGQYMGTNNPVQLADTFGFSANAGLGIGTFGLPMGFSLNAMAEGSVNVNVTHIKPLTSLKQGITEPLDEQMVPWLTSHAASVFQNISDSEAAMNKELHDSQGGTPSQVVAANQKVQAQLADELAKLEKFIGNGESLILTETISGIQEVAAGYQFQVPLVPEIGPSATLNEIVVSRIQLLRQDQNGKTTFSIFKDNGEMIGPTFAFEAAIGVNATTQASFPILNMSVQKVAGSATSNYYSIDVTPNAQNSTPDQNGNAPIYQSSAALASMLKTGSITPVENLFKQENRHPVVIQNKFSDKVSSFQFFHWVDRGLKTGSTLTVALNDGTTDKYVELTDGKQTGKSYQSLATNAATFLAQYLANSATYSVNTNANLNPGQSFLGESQTRNAFFEGKLNAPEEKGAPETLDQPYVKVQYRWEGWDLSSKSAQDLVNTLSQKYGFTLYPEGFLGDTKDIKLYELLLNVNLYQDGLSQILSMSEKDQKAFENGYRAMHNCDAWDDGQMDQLQGDDAHICSTLEDFDSAFSSYRKMVSHKGKPITPKDATKEAKAIFSLVSNLEQFASFSDLYKLSGQDAHKDEKRLYVSSQISGFKIGSETPSTTPINSNSFGNGDNNGGPIDSLQNNILNIQDGEFNMSWLRTVL